MTIKPPKLKQGDRVRVIAPARSLGMSRINQELKSIAEHRFNEMGLNVSFSKNVYDLDCFDSSSIEMRVSDIHDAFSDKSINLIITAIGGFNSNQILRYLDYDLIKSNPKIICGYSDITALSNAIYAKTGLITYSGPHFFSFGDKKGFDYTLEYFKKCLFEEDPFTINPSLLRSNDRRATDQNNRKFLQNDGFWIINEGKAEAKIIGGNQCTFNLLQGTEFMPDIKDSILFLEDDDETHVATIDRDLQSIIHQPDFKMVQAIFFGRFKPETKMTKDLLIKMVKSKKELQHLPFIANVDFGHTTPMITFPIGGSVKFSAYDGKVTLEIVEH